MESDGLDEPTGVDWEGWNFKLTEHWGAIDKLVKAAQADAAEVVTRQIISDQRSNPPSIHSYGYDEKTDTCGGDVKLCIQLIEGTETYVFYDLDSLLIEPTEPYPEHARQEMESIIEALQALVDKAKAIHNAL